MSHLIIYLDQELQKYPDVAKRASDKFKNNFLSCVQDQSVIEIIEGLRDIQKISMEHFQVKRRELLHSHRKTEADLEESQNLILRKRSIRNAGAVVSADGYMLLQRDELKQKNSDELEQFDMNIVHDLDQKLFDQQQTLQTAGVPGFFCTTKPEDVNFQMKLMVILFELLDFIKNDSCDS